MNCFLVRLLCTLDDIPLFITGGRTTAENWAREFYNKLAECEERSESLDRISELELIFNMDFSSIVAIDVCEFVNGEIVSQMILHSFDEWLSVSYV